MEEDYIFKFLPPTEGEIKGVISHLGHAAYVPDTHRRTVRRFFVLLKKRDFSDEEIRYS